MKGEIDITINLDAEGNAELMRQGCVTVEHVVQRVTEMLEQKVAEAESVHLGDTFSLTLSYKAYVFGPPRPGSEDAPPQTDRLELLLDDV